MPRCGCRREASSTDCRQWPEAFSRCSWCSSGKDLNVCLHHLLFQVAFSHVTAGHPTLCGNLQAIELNLQQFQRFACVSSFPLTPEMFNRGHSSGLCFAFHVYFQTRPFITDRFSAEICLEEFCQPCCS